MKKVSEAETSHALDGVFDACALLQAAAFIAQELSDRMDGQYVRELDSLAKLLRVAEKQLDGAMDLLDTLECIHRKAA